MVFTNLNVSINFLIQTKAGMLGTFSLLYLYNFTLVTVYILPSTDLILNQLVMASSLVLSLQRNPSDNSSFWIAILPV